MSTVLKVVLGVLGPLALLIVVGVTSYISAYNLGNRSEVNLTKALNHNKNVLATYTQKVMEVAQVPELMRDDMSKVVKDALGSRYGADGSKAMFQMIKEQNPSLDPALYRNIQQIIESGRNDFKEAQDELLDKKAVYQTSLGSFWTGTWLKIAGYPKINLDDIKIVTTDQVETNFNTGRSAPLQLRPKQ